MTSHIVLDGSHIGNTWDWLEIMSWSTMDGELWDDPTLGHNHFKEHFYWRYNHSTWYSTLGHTPFIDDWFLRWWFILRQLLKRLCMVDIAILLFLVEHEVIRVCWGYIGIFIFRIERWDWPYYDDTCWDIALSLAWTLIYLGA